MNTARFVRSVSFLVGLASSLAMVGAVDAHSPLRGKWLADAPGGISTYCFSHGHRDKHDKHSDIGRFSHSYIDCYGGLVVLHGTWVLHHHGAEDTLDLHFDNNIHMHELTCPNNGLLPLWNAGTGTALSYGRTH